MNNSIVDHRYRCSNSWTPRTASNGPSGSVVGLSQEIMDLPGPSLENFQLGDEYWPFKVLLTLDRPIFGLFLPIYP